LGGLADLDWMGSGFDGVLGRMEQDDPITRSAYARQGTIRVPVREAQRRGGWQSSPVTRRGGGGGDESGSYQSESGIAVEFAAHVGEPTAHRE